MLNLISFQLFGEAKIVYTQTAEMKQIMEIPTFGIHKLWGKTETFIRYKELGRQDNFIQISRRHRVASAEISKITFRNKAFTSIPIISVSNTLVLMW